MNYDTNTHTKGLDEMFADAVQIHDYEDDIIPFLSKATWSDFAMSLYGFWNRNGYLTENQLTAARKMKIKADTRRNNVDVDIPETQGLDLSGVPSGYYAVPNGDTRLKLKIEQGQGRWEGFTFVKDAAVYGRGSRYGMQKPGGSYSGQLTVELTEIARDPFAASCAYGRLTSTCGVCGRHLEDETSVANGIGPVCAGKF